MHSVWRVHGHVSGRNPPSEAAGESPDPLPALPDPPDPSSPLSPNNFPSLSEAKTVQKSVKTFYRSVTSSTVCKGASPPTAISLWPQLKLRVLKLLHK